MKSTFEHDSSLLNFEAQTLFDRFTGIMMIVARHKSTKLLLILSGFMLCLNIVYFIRNVNNKSKNSIIAINANCHARSILDQEGEFTPTDLTRSKCLNIRNNTKKDLPTFLDFTVLDPSPYLNKSLKKNLPRYNP